MHECVCVCVCLGQKSLDCLAREAPRICMPSPVPQGWGYNLLAHRCWRSEDRPSYLSLSGSFYTEPSPKPLEKHTFFSVGIPTSRVSDSCHKLVILARDAGAAWATDTCVKKKKKNRAGEMAQRLRVLLTALPKVLSLNPSTHMGAHNHPM